MAENSHKKQRHFRKFIPDEAVEHAKAARKEMRMSLETILPPEFVARRKAARREMLLAVREIVNHALERIDAQETD